MWLDRLSAIPVLAFALALSGGCDPEKQVEGVEDSDGDGVTAADDCDETDATVHPGAAEVAYDGLDNDCDPSTPDDDLDGDGAGAAATGGADCDDADASVGPHATERCDGVDNDCDGEADGEDAADASAWYADADGDGYGDAGGVILACELPDGAAAQSGDCDDGDAAVHPGGAEVAYNGLDDDCDPSTLEDDLDGDGYATLTGDETDCDDTDAEIYPGADEVCDDGLINDCKLTEAEAMQTCGVGGTTSLSGADVWFEGLTGGSRAGRGLAGDLDIDGDGRTDLLLSAYRSSDAAYLGGAIYLLRGSGALAGLTGEGSLLDADAKITGGFDELYAGETLADLGDLDADGLDDALVGAYGDSTGGDRAGGAYVMLGGGALAGASGELNISSADLKIVGEAAGDLAGTPVAAGGDVDGDGLPDALVAAAYAGPAGPYSGSVYLLLSAGTLGSASSRIGLSDADLELEGEATEDLAGLATASAGDVDGDGLDEVLVGALGDRSIGSYSGATYLLLGSTAAGLSGPVSLADADLKLLGEAKDDSAGAGVSSAGDLDDDGLGDVLVGACGESTAASMAGAVYLLYGGGALSGAAGVSSLSGADYKLTGETAGAYAGGALASAGDVDGDGRGDVLATAPYDATAAFSAGAAYLLLSSGALESPSGEDSLSVSDLTLTGEGADDGAGRRVAAAGDVNGDSFADLLIGADSYDGVGYSSGKAYLIFGGGY